MSSVENTTMPNGQQGIGTRPGDSNTHRVVPETLTIPRQLLEELAALTWPPATDRRMQDLMDRNTEGDLSEEEYAELGGLIEVSSTLSLFKGQAMRLLTQGRR